MTRARTVRSPGPSRPKPTELQAVSRLAVSQAPHYVVSRAEQPVQQAQTAAQPSKAK